jgi:hypothetical protein
MGTSMSLCPGIATRDYHQGLLLGIATATWDCYLRSLPGFATSSILGHPGDSLRHWSLERISFVYNYLQAIREKSC